MNTESLNLFFAALDAHPAYMLLVIIWSLIWKGLALWRAGGLRQRNWFIAMLIINSLGILEIIYLYLTRKDKVEVIES